MGLLFSHSKLLARHNSIHPPEVEPHPARAGNGCLYNGLMKQRQHTQCLHPEGMHLSMYNCIYRVTPSVFSRGRLRVRLRLQLQHSPRRPAETAWYQQTTQNTDTSMQPAIFGRLEITVIVMQVHGNHRVVLPSSQDALYINIAASSALTSMDKVVQYNSIRSEGTELGPLRISRPDSHRHSSCLGFQSG